MAELPDDVLAMLALEQHMFVLPGTWPFGDYNKPAEPTSPAGFAALVERTVRELMERPVNWHGSPPNPHVVFPGGHICGECGEDVSVLIEMERERGDRG